MSTFVETAGKKPNWAREIDVDNFQDMFGLSAAATLKLTVVSGKSVIDQAGQQHHVITAVVTAQTITLTDYAKFGIGSRIYHTGATTPTVYVKCAASANPALGDWYKEELTQHS
jgi:hypothetical protein